jgi:HAD superfamily phosphoserine phosphatase-like hydrolase
MTSRIALVDWDGTIRKNFTILSWAQHLGNAGVVSGEIVEDMEGQFALYSRGLISHNDLAAGTAAVYAGHLTGIADEEVRKLIPSFLNTDRAFLFLTCLRLLSYLSEKGIEVIVISGAPSEILTEYQKFYPLKRIFGLELETRKGLFTGRVKVNPGMSSTKGRIVRKLNEEEGRKAVLAMGNSISDVPLFKAARINIVVNNGDIRTLGKTFSLDPAGDVEATISMLEEALADGDNW